MSNAIAGVSTTFGRYNGAEWEEIAEINAIIGPGMSKDAIDVTSLDTEKGYNEFVAGFLNAGTLALNMSFTREGYELMKQDFEEDIPQSYYVSLPDDDDTTIEFEGFVTEIPVTVELGDKVKANVTIKITSDIALDADWIEYWDALGFSPESTGEQNLIALNKALTDRRYVKIVTPGVYDFNATILIPSDTTLEICEGVTLRKETGSKFAYIIGNKGMLTKTADYNINVIGNGVLLDINGIDVYSNVDDEFSIIPRLRGVFTFFKVFNFEISGLKIDDVNIDSQYAMHLNDCHYGDISDLDFYLTKDCCDVMSCTNIDFNNIKFISTDDSFFIGIGSYGTCDTVGPTEKIHISNIEIGCPVYGGWLARLYAADIVDWVSGYDFAGMKYCINDGKIYGRTGVDDTPVIGTVAPTHEDGNVTGADGIEWWRLYGDPVNKVDLFDVSFTNVTFLSLKQGIFFRTFGHDDSSIIENTILDNITLCDNYNVPFITWQANVGNAIIKNSNLIFGSNSYLFLSNLKTKTFNKFTLDNCNIELNAFNGLMNLKVDDCIISEIEIINSYINSLDVPFFVIRGSSAEIGKLTVTDSEIISPSGTLLLVGDNQFAGPNVFTNVIFDNVYDFVRLEEAGASTTIELYNCEFKTGLRYLAIASVADSGVINYKSRGTKYITPTVYLFYCTTEVGGIVIDVLESTGTVTPAKVRNGANVVVTNCDLPYV